MSNVKKLDSSVKFFDTFRDRVKSQNAYRYLTPGGYLAFETGINQACDVKDIMQANGFENIEILNDVSGIQRVISGTLPQKS